jgi:uncharacterized membrane protein YedE/YeeE
MDTGIFYLITINLMLGLAAGAIMHRSDYCVAGMFRDLFLFKHTLMLRTLLLLVITSMVLFESARRLGLLSPYPFPLLGSLSAANIAGGFLFGIGMVLAGGCVVGTLYKMGSGSMISATAFLGLIAGSGLYAELHPWWRNVAGASSFLQGSITLPQAVNLDPGLIILPCVLIAAFFFIRWARESQWQQFSAAEGYIQPWKAALSLAVLGTLSYLLVGMPFGVSTAYAKMAAYLELLIVPAHVADTAFYNTIPLSYTNQLLDLPLTGGAGPTSDAISFIQFPVITGIIIGSALSTLSVGEFKIYFRVPARQYLSAFAGGIILALGSRMTPGCNIWHLFGGLPILALQSIFFLSGIFPGAYIGTMILKHLVLPSRRTV